MKRRYDVYLTDLLTAIGRVKEYTAGMDFSSFTKSEITVDAVLRNLEIIGEIATQLPEELTTDHPEVPWRDIKAFRVVVAHKYWNIDLSLVWEIVTTRLDSLEKQIQEILNRNKE